MAIALTEVDLEEILAVALTKGEVTYENIGCEVRESLPSQLGTGSDRIIQLRHGLSVAIRNFELWDSIIIENPHPEAIPLISKFHLSSNSRVLTPGIPGIKDDYEEIAGCNYLYYLPDLIEFEEWFAEEQIQIVLVYLELDCLRSFGESFEFLPQPLQRLITGDSTSRFHQPLGKTTPAASQILEQIINCPYQGMIKQIYLESKALELLTWQFTRWTEHSQHQPRSLTLRRDDIERLHDAKHILTYNLENPPSLLELARQVGLNERKLKQGFHKVFGTTVFGYLHDYRMERARQLFVTTQMSVTEVAYAVGYASLPSFCKAFRKKFGSSPLKYLSGICANNVRLG